MAILTVFRSRLMVGVEELYDTLAEEASVLFANRQSHEVWRDHPRHREIQTIGRTQLYAEYQVYTAEVDYSQSFVVDALP